MGTLKDAILQALAEVGGMDYLRRIGREGAHAFTDAQIAKLEEMIKDHREANGA